MSDTRQQATGNRQQVQVALVLCGALAREVKAIVEARGWNAALFGVAALDHMFPERIAPDVERRLRELIPQFGRVIVVYGDCGSRGALDAVLARYNVPRIAGPHCYEMYAGAGFAQLMDDELGTFFLTDFLVRGFKGTVIKGLGLDRFPELRPIYFGNYRRVVYLIQQEDPALLARAEAIASELGLPLELRRTGFGLLEARLAALMAEIHEERHRPLLPELQEWTSENGRERSDTLLARHPGASAGEGRRRARQRPAREPLSGGGRQRGDGDG